MTLSRKNNPEDPVRLEPGVSRLRVAHFTTEPRGDPPLPFITNDLFCGECRFNATLTAKVISWRLMTHMTVFPGFLTPVDLLTQLFFQSDRLLFSHSSAEVRGENTPGRTVRLNRRSNSQPPGHESDTLTTEPPGRVYQPFGICLYCIKIVNNLDKALLGIPIEETFLL